MGPDGGRSSSQVQGAGGAAPKRLTILVTNTQRRGAEVFGERLADGLPGLGWAVDFVALGSARPGLPVVGAHPLSDRPVGRLDPGVVRRLRARLKSHQPAVVLAFGSSTLHYGVVGVRSLADRPRLSYASIGDPTYWASDRRRKLTYRAFLALVDEVIAVSDPTGSLLVEQLGVRRSRLRVLPTGVPDELFTEAAPRSDDGALRVLFLGSLADEKDPLAAVTVMRSLGADTPATLRMVGAGPLESQVRRSAEAPELAGRVEVVGSVRDVRPFLAWADVLLLTSRTEGLPAATLEAAAAGVPSIAFDVGGVSQTVLDGATGRLIRPGDVSGAADALRAYARDPSLLEAAGASARSMALDMYTMDAALRRYDHALSELASKGSSR